MNRFVRYLRKRRGDDGKDMSHFDKWLFWFSRRMNCQLAAVVDTAVWVARTEIVNKSTRHYYSEMSGLNNMTL